MTGLGLLTVRSRSLLAVRAGGLLTVGTGLLAVRAGGLLTVGTGGLAGLLRVAVAGPRRGLLRVAVRRSARRGRLRRACRCRRRLCGGGPWGGWPGGVCGGMAGFGWSWGC
ncbi:hypothetical protein MWG59_14245 [Streptomyces sp. WAC00303]|nr:hypothetical protein MWG59_14245 [Streptomyces sp. WAC00303]